MKQINIFLLTSLIVISFSSCGSVKEGFTNQKKNNSDEFLVEKKSPLIMPPNYDDLPSPKTQNVSDSLKRNDIKELIIKTTENNKDSSDKANSEGTIEKVLLKKIKDK